MTRRSLIQTVVASAIAVVVAVAIVGSPNRIAGSPTSITEVKSQPVKRPLSRRWYSSRSLWNRPIAAHPAIASNNASLIAAWSDTSSCNLASNFSCLETTYDYTPAIWMAARGTPSVRVRIDVPRCGVDIVRVPIPAEAVPDPSHEGHMAIASATGTEYDFYEAQSPHRPPKAGCPATSMWTAGKVITTNWQTGSGELRGSVRGSGTPEGAGTILPRDTQQPAGSTWDHALAISYRNTCSHAMSWCPYVAPATDEDGTCTDESKCVPQGARFQLDPSINCRTWPSLLYEWQRQMCRTLKVYGAIVVDTNTGGIGIYDQWHGSLGRYIWPWQRTGDSGIPNDLLSYFRVLAWR